MLELPESRAMAAQLRVNILGKTIERVIANASPHGFAWFFGDPASYEHLLTGRKIGDAFGVGGLVQIMAEGATLLFGDGSNLRLYGPDEKLPPKHQLLLGFDDGYTLVVSVQMYGGIWAYLDGTNDNGYYRVACEKPSPLEDAFDAAYFANLYASAKPSLSAKAFLATEQRIPGFGNGVLQDILFLSGIHPQRPIRSFGEETLDRLFRQVKQSLAQMTEQGGRDVETDLFGKPGGYRTLLSRKTWTYQCPQCGGAIERKAYLGGKVYFCPTCQPLEAGD